MGALTTGSRGSAPESWSSFPSCFDGAGGARKHGFTSSGSSSTGWRRPPKRGHSVLRPVRYLRVASRSICITSRLVLC